MINTAVAVNAAHKMRFAQDLALFNLDLAEATDAFDGQAHRVVWQDAPEWQPTREVVEQLTAVGDWCQLLFATNIVFEQLVGSLFRSELVMQIAARNGDYITPTIVGTGEYDYDRDLNYTRNLFRLLTRDPEHGEANKALFGHWLALWVPRCLAAAHALQPIWSTPADKPVTFASSLDAAKAKFRSVLESLELDIPEELDK
jgi:propane monooxygenase small subunit